MDTEYTYIKGVLGYNSSNDCYGLLACDLWEIDGFHCGDALDVWDYDRSEWRSSYGANSEKTQFFFKVVRKELI